MIEGTQSSLSDLLLFELDMEPGVPLDDVREVPIARHRGSRQVGAKPLTCCFVLCNFRFWILDCGLRPRGAIGPTPRREGGTQSICYFVWGSGAGMNISYTFNLTPPKIMGYGI
jgi:hypothetical protein